MKTLANCNPLEFLKQTNKIRKSVAKWLTLTGVMELRRRLPNPGDGDAGEAMRRQIEKNAYDMLGAILEDHPRETAELLCLMCFIEPEDMASHSMSELIGGFTEMMNCREIADFFVSLARLVSENTSAPVSPSASISLSSTAAGI